MKIKYKPESFERINSLPYPQSDKISIISEVLLLKEFLRQLCQLNSCLNTKNNEYKFSLFILNRIYPGILTDGSEVLKCIEKHKSNNWYFNIYYTGFVNHYLAWELLSEDKSILDFKISNPYEYAIRIFERGLLINQEKHPISLQVGASGNIFDTDIKKLFQPNPYIVSYDNSYLDDIDMYYSKNQKLPDWLYKDKKIIVPQSPLGHSEGKGLSISDLSQ